jgi:hypothetical protein
MGHYSAALFGGARLQERKKKKKYDRGKGRGEGPLTVGPHYWIASLLIRTRRSCCLQCITLN